jgi:hypothetical protein
MKKQSPGHRHSTVGHEMDGPALRASRDYASRCGVTQQSVATDPLDDEPLMLTGLGLFAASLVRRQR